MRIVFLALLLAGCATYPPYEPPPGADPLPGTSDLEQRCRYESQMAFINAWPQLSGRRGFSAGFSKGLAGRAKKLTYRECMRRGEDAGL